MFSRTVTDYWLRRDAALDDVGIGEYRVVIDDSLPAHRSLTILEPRDGGGVLTLTAAHAARLELIGGSTVGGPALRSALEATKVNLNGADHLFYLPVEEHAVVRNEVVSEGTRQLTEKDAAQFTQFAAGAPADEMDEAFVELDHWLVFGTFVDGQLVTAASMYPWTGAQLADLGVITLPEYRGRGLGRRTVRAMSARSLADGYEPQYRCQLDNEPSIALARAAGFARFGTWDVIAAGPPP
jgi:RimJ/RimL family protein N-acetyltransferase